MRGEVERGAAGEQRPAKTAARALQYSRRGANAGRFQLFLKDFQIVQAVADEIMP